MGLAAAMPLKPVITTYPLEQANQALNDLREGNINGTAVLVMD
jgi:propanol-preferring alcohol dehydrogenase